MGHEEVAELLREDVVPCWGLSCYGEVDDIGGCEVPEPGAAWIFGKGGFGVGGHFGEDGDGVGELAFAD